MRVTTTKPNTLRLHDNISDSSLELFFRNPTTKECAQYTNGMTKRIRNKLVNCTGECRQKHGKDILEGFRDGDFGEEKNDKVVMVSSASDSANYRSDWKDWFCKNNADLVERLAIHAFEQTADTDDGIDLPDDEGETTDPN